MEQDTYEKTTLQILRAMTAMYVLIAVAEVVLFETGAVEGGLLAYDQSLNFAMLTAMEIFTICSIPTALKLMSIKRIRRRISQEGPKEYRRWAVVRLDLVGAPMIVNLFLYYMTYSVAFVYMAIISALCITFVYPSEGRYRNETNTEK